MSEHRKIARRRVLKAGTISINRAGGIDCTVRNLSDAGACLDVASPLGIPDDFDLVIGDDHSHHPCHVIWRSDKRIGISFA
jgi:PilZ domain-containing protein